MDHGRVWRSEGKRKEILNRKRPRQRRLDTVFKDYQIVDEPMIWAGDAEDEEEKDAY